MNAFLKDNSAIDLDWQQLNSLHRIETEDHRTRHHLDDLNSLLDDPSDTLPEVEQPTPQPVPLALVPEPEIERDIKLLNSIFKASLDLYERLIDQSRGSEADDQKARIRLIISEFDERHGDQSHKRYIDRALVRRFLDLTTRRNAINPAFDVPRSSQIKGVLTPAKVANFEKNFSKTASGEVANFENDSSKMAIANFEKPVSKMASGDSSHFWETARAKNTTKTPDLRAFDDVLQSGPSLKVINTYNNHPKNTLKTPLTNHPKTGPKTQKAKNQKIAPKTTPFTLAQKEPLPTPDVKPRPAQTTSFIEDLSDPFRRRWHDLTLNDKLALSFIETERHGGYSFRLTFSAQLAWKLLAASDPATVFCRDHLRQALKQEFGKVLPYSFRFEFSKDGTLHIHGAIITPEMERTGIEERLRGVLNKAGGCIGTATQSHVAQIYDPLRYFYYLEKSAKETRNKMESNKKGITSISGEVKQLIKSLHDTNRTNTKQN